MQCGLFWTTKRKSFYWVKTTLILSIAVFLITLFWKKPLEKFTKQELFPRRWFCVYVTSRLCMKVKHSPSMMVGKSQQSVIGERESFQSKLSFCLNKFKSHYESQRCLLWVSLKSVKRLKFTSGLFANKETWVVRFSPLRNGLISVWSFRRRECFVSVDLQGKYEKRVVVYYFWNYKLKLQGHFLTIQKTSREISL